MAENGQNSMDTNEMMKAIMLQLSTINEEIARLKNDRESTTKNPAPQQTPIMPRPPPTMAQPPVLPIFDNSDDEQYEEENCRPHLDKGKGIVDRLDKMAQEMESMKMQGPKKLNMAEYMIIPGVVLPPNFKMPDHDKYDGTGCPKSHLKALIPLLQQHGLTPEQIALLFPRSLTGTAKKWFLSLKTEEIRTLEDIANRFVEQFSMEEGIDVTKRDLKALKQGHNETFTSFIRRWRRKAAQMTHRLSDADQIKIVVKNLSPQYYHHMAIQYFLDFNHLIKTGTQIEDALSKGLRSRSSSDVREGKRPIVAPKEVHNLNYTRPSSYARPPGYDQPPSRTVTEVRRPIEKKVFRQFDPLPYSLSVALKKLLRDKKITLLEPRELPNPLPKYWRKDQYCDYHQNSGHLTDKCMALRHKIQDMIEAKDLAVEAPNVTRNPLPTHAMPPPNVYAIFTEEILLDHSRICAVISDRPYVLRWDDEDEAIENKKPYILSLPDEGLTGSSECSCSYVLKSEEEEEMKEKVPYVLRLEEEDLLLLEDQCDELRHVTRGGRVFKPVELRAENPAEIARASENQRQRQTHRQVVLRELNASQVSVEITPDELVSLVAMARTSKTLSFTDEDLPPEGRDHTRPLRITIICNKKRVPEVLVDNGSALNVCPLSTAVTLGFGPNNFIPSEQGILAYDGTRRDVIGILATDIEIGGETFEVEFQVLDIKTSFFLLLGRPWLHKVGVIPSTLHQKLKFVRNNKVITVRGDPEPEVGQITSELNPEKSRDVSLTGFSLEISTISFGEAMNEEIMFLSSTNTQVVKIMRKYGYVPGTGLGRNLQGPTEWPELKAFGGLFGLGYEPTPKEVQEMKRYMMKWAECRRRGIEFLTGPYSMIMNGRFRREGADCPFYGFPETWCDKTGKRLPGLEIFFTDELSEDFYSTIEVGVVLGGGEESVPVESRSEDVFTDSSFVHSPVYVDTDVNMSFHLNSESVTPDVGESFDVIINSAKEIKDSFVYDPIFISNSVSDSASKPDQITNNNNNQDSPSNEEADETPFEIKYMIQQEEIRRAKPLEEEIETVNIGDETLIREIRIGKTLSPEEREELITLLKEFKEVFAWSYDDMPGLSEDIVQHRLPLIPGIKPKKQKLRKLKTEWELKVHDEVKKLLEVKFIEVVEYPEWLANIVPVPKKDGKVRMCVDFRDLNKASPKDDFPLPNIDILVDNTAGHALLSFMDGFSGYNQIKMAPEDMMKTAFITQWGTYCYRVMPFGLKNAGATYQRAATTLLHDMIHKEVEVYVDDMIVKGRTRPEHTVALRKFFERIRKFQLRLNPNKCVFGVTSGKLLGFMVSERGIEVDPQKIKAIQEMQPPKTEKQIRGFLGKVQYLRRFISHLTMTCEPIFKLLKKNSSKKWNEECQEAFEKVKQCLSLPPVLSPVIPGQPLLMYLSITDTAMGCMLAQQDVGSKKEKPIYYISKKMLEYEIKYTILEKTCLALVWATQRLRHYLLSNKVFLLSRMDPLKYLFEKPALTGRTARWLLLLSEFDITYVTQKSVKGRVIAEQLADAPVEENAFLKAEFPDEEIMELEEEIPSTRWTMYFDGAVNNRGQGIGAVLVSPKKEYIPISIKLQFECTNNMAEYEACIAGLEAALILKVQEIDVFGDSILIICQTNGNWKTRESKLIPYNFYLESLAKKFKSKGHPPEASNKERKTLQRFAANFIICGEELYRRSFDGIQLLCVDEDQAAELIEQTHEGVCGPHMNGKMLSRKILRLGFYWPSMETDCFAFVKKCHKCQVYANLIHVPPSELHSMTSPWPFSVWGIDIIGKVYPKSSSGHEYILVAIDYFTKWIEAASYASITSNTVAKFIRANIICRYGVPHELISDNGSHFKKEVVHLCEEFKIKHHKSSPYRPQTNGAVEAANKNIKVIISKMTETYKDWSNKLPFALWAYRTSIRSSTGVTPYSLVYGMEAVLPVEVRIPSLRVMMEANLPESEWAKARHQELQMIDEKRLRALYHIQGYQRRIERAFNKKVKVRDLKPGDLVLKSYRAPVFDPRGKFRPNWSGPYIVDEVLPGKAVRLLNENGEKLTEPTNLDQLKKYYA
ncbi:uncharacterized protein LOC143859575 [Tasmannia lanceolata]|uniref:uncharacterized protein LOC143859575 n=1 Tax=Tasmannia lanceolata TaxID=3420 RepID=UPI004063AA14